jgi:hypothetical protein
MDLASKQQELERLRGQVQQLETEIVKEQAEKGWRASGYYTAYYATAGFVLGIFGAMASLLFNVISAPIAGKTPLELIRVYLTFPLGEKALQLSGAGPAAYAVGDGVILAIGCCLYLGTGMLLGIPVYLALTRFAGKGGPVARLAVATVVSLAIWAFNFYAVLSWLQPLLVGGDPGNWITNPKFLPWWVAAATHLIFGWTIALLYSWGAYTPYRRMKETKTARFAGPDIS